MLSVLQGNLLCEHAAKRETHQVKLVRAKVCAGLHHEARQQDRRVDHVGFRRLPTAGHLDRDQACVGKLGRERRDKLQRGADTIEENQRCVRGLIIPDMDA